VIRVDTSAKVDRPVEDVARYVSDIERMSEWTDMTVSRRLTDGPTREGTKAYAEVALGPIKLGWTYVIEDIDPTGGFAFKTITRNALGMDGSIRLTEAGPAATTIDYHVDIHTRGVLRVLEPLLRGDMSRNEASELDRLKARLEGRAGAQAVST
jgi:carbon monoxide dehydrogenase subunit G